MQFQPEKIRKYFEYEPVRYAAWFNFNNADSIRYPRKKDWIDDYRPER